MTTGPTVYGFVDEYAFLTNFYPSPIVVWDMEFPTVEHAYQAFKSTDNDRFERIRTAATPGIAFRMGAQVPTSQYRKNWLRNREQHMYALLVAKFTQHEDLAEQLIATHPSNLVHANQFGENFWGIVNNKGTNMLGLQLMHIRQRFVDGELTTGDQS